MARHSIPSSIVPLTTVSRPPILSVQSRARCPKLIVSSTKKIKRKGCIYKRRLLEGYVLYGSASYSSQSQQHSLCRYVHFSCAAHSLCSVARFTYGWSHQNRCYYSHHIHHTSYPYSNPYSP